MTRVDPALSGSSASVETMRFLWSRVSATTRSRPAWDITRTRRTPVRSATWRWQAQRVTNGQPFRDFLDLQAGDAIEIETRTHLYTYVLDDDGDERVVDLSAGWVFDRVPGSPDLESAVRKAGH